MNIETLPPHITDWIRAHLGSQAEIKSINKLQGSTSSDLFRINLQETSHSYTLVLRLLTNSEWLIDEPDLAEHEAAALLLARQTGLPVPEVVGWDGSGLKCGVPAVLMTHLPGDVDLQPVDFDDWLRQMAQALSQIHSVNAASLKWKYYSYNDPKNLQIPTWTKSPHNWERAIRIVNQPPPPETLISFIHRDYHPMNTLWQDGRLSGIVDWINACRGPAPFDLAWNRLNLMQMYGVEATDRLRDLALEICGDGVWHPYWDLMAMIELLPGPIKVYEPWPLFGLKNLSEPLLIERADEYLASVLSHC